MTSKLDVLFVCLHGSGKSIVAARHLERLARDEGIDLVCGSAGLEPDDDLPPRVVDGLSGDGIDVSVLKPRPVTVELVATARHVVSLGCDLTPFGDPAAVARWDDLPAVSDGYAPARDAIVAKLRNFLPTITSSRGEGA